MDITTQSSLLRSLEIQRRVMHALMLREIITRFGRENLGVLWLVAEPMLFTLGVTTLWTAAGLHHGSPIPIVALCRDGLLLGADVAQQRIPSRFGRREQQAAPLSSKRSDD